MMLLRNISYNDLCKIQKTYSTRNAKHQRLHLYQKSQPYQIMLSTYVTWYHAIWLHEDIFLILFFPCFR